MINYFQIMFFFCKLLGGKPETDTVQSIDSFDSEGTSFDFQDQRYECVQSNGHSALKITSLREPQKDPQFIVDRPGGANVQEPQANLDQQNESGESPLIYASVNGHYKVAELLLQNGANVDLRDKNGLTALMRASCVGDHKFVQLLLKHGAKLDLQDSSGQSALMYACKLPQCDVAQLLVDRGADVDLQAPDWESAMSIAMLNSKKQSELISLLQRRIEEVVIILLT